MLNTFFSSLENTLHLLDLTNDFVLVIDCRGNIVHTNSAYERILGMDRESAKKILWGNNISKMVSDTKVWEVLESGKPLYDFREIIEKAGIEVQGNIIPVKAGKKVLGVICIMSLVQISELFETVLRYRKKYVRENVKFQFKNMLAAPFRELVGNNINFVKTLVKANAAAMANTTLLIMGESGVGKEVLARAIHLASERMEGPFVAVNCAAIPESLLESELFGYEGGAFTGALREGKLGKLELADGGTLFLDEIGDLSMSMQAKLLRVLQFKQIERVGGVKKIDIDIRIISATNRNLWERTVEGMFREDLYYRLNVIPIVLPELCDRKDDIHALSQHFLTRLQKEYKVNNIRLASEVIMLFHDYHWPGNIRELGNVVEHAFVLANAEGANVISTRHLPGMITKGLAGGIDDDAENTADGGKVERYQNLELPEAIAMLESDMMQKALEDCDYNKTKAIKKLGISKGAFYNKIKRYGLKLDK